MSLKTDVKQSIEKLTESKAFHAVAGAGDLAAEKLREVQDRITEWDVQAGLAAVPNRLAEAGEKAQERARQLPEKFAALRADPKAAQAAMQERARQLPERAQDVAVRLAGLAAQTYEELAERGRAVIQRRQGAAEQATAQEPVARPPTAAAEPVAEEPIGTAGKAVAEAGAEPSVPRQAKKVAARKPRAPSPRTRKTSGRTTKKA